eukprot:jgi/Tetstr1/432620/TSEL_021989.t1
MACAKADELPEKIQRELAQYVERFNEWKKMCSVMNRLDKVLKEYMIGNNIDFIEDEGVRLSMAHPTRWMLDQSLIVDIDQYKVKKTINVLTVNVDEDQEHVRIFLEHIFSDELGHFEIMPFHDGNDETFKKHMPLWITKICVHYYYKSWAAEDDNAILLGEAHFVPLMT